MVHQKREAKTENIQEESTETNRQKSWGLWEMDDFLFQAIGWYIWVTISSAFRGIKPVGENDPACFVRLVQNKATGTQNLLRARDSLLAHSTSVGNFDQN